MNTTIAVKPKTLELLWHMKSELKAENLDATIKQLALFMKKPRKSMFGTMKGVKAEFEREEIDRFD